MIDIEKRYQTKSGKQVRLYAIEVNEILCVHGAIMGSDGAWRSVARDKDGSFSLGKETENDLIEVKVKEHRTYWMNLYPSGGYATYASKRNADRARKVSFADNALACVKVDIDFEVGEGL